MKAQVWVGYLVDPCDVEQVERQVTNVRKALSAASERGFKVVIDKDGDYVDYRIIGDVDALAKMIEDNLESITWGTFDVPAEKKEAMALRFGVKVAVEGMDEEDLID